MKKKQIDGDDVAILLLGDVPADCRDIRKEGDIDQSWHFFCHLSDLTERKAERLIEDLLDSKTAKEAFYKMLSANGILTKNPHGQNAMQHASVASEGGDFNHLIIEWKNAESNVFNPETTILFTSKIVP